MAWLFGLAALMLLDSGTVLDAVNGAAGLFVRSVMPALFPMMVLKRPVRPAGRAGAAVDDGVLLLAVRVACVGPAAGRAAGSGASCAGRELLPMAAATGVMSPLFFVGSLGSRLPNPAARLAAADRPLARARWPRPG